MILDLNIDSLAFGGSGVGRHDGKVVFVPFTAPGDLIRCRIVREKKRFAEGEILELIEPSSARREPPCPVFGVCGGCQWQHLPYETQSRWKGEIFADTLRRQGGGEEELLRPLVRSSEEWNYRSRVQFKCLQTDNGFVMGFYRRGSHFVVDIENCPITASPLNEALHLFRRWLPQSPCPERIPQVDMAVDDENKVRIVVHALGSDHDALRAFLSPLAESAGFAIFIQTGRKSTIIPVVGGEDLHIHPLPGGSLRLAYGPGGFAQVNLEQNRRLVEGVIAAADLTGEERVLDLFCGMGNFSLPLAQKAKEVIGVEDFEPAIEKARDNARENGLSNMSFHARTAEGAAGKLAGGMGLDLVLLDPPRTGAYEVVRDLLSVRPAKIIYVSCDPPTLARDLKPLLHGGYRLIFSTPFDLFPQTHHTESLSLLIRQD
ncbi:23S rRNA (uracil(1939)-C(5))-methyltransferase RlmD [Desulfuromonas sp. TF]|uniref:23S rRNA (uracil(1939)-C(5))-methyltransferase RlmD n=1 Tax=Desulfuromonas sp. TF TaxID=1232410 RepID=UPI0003F9ABA5|nr:23S rRNA (uracil(1939)-C(5))-methyltransferase RlmD [Desulfuromonas sp. TF]